MRISKSEGNRAGYQHENISNWKTPTIPYTIFAFKYPLQSKHIGPAQLPALNPKSNVIEKYSISNGKKELCAIYILVRWEWAARVCW